MASTSSNPAVPNAHIENRPVTLRAGRPPSLLSPDSVPNATVGKNGSPDVSRSRGNSCSSRSSVGEDEEEDEEVTETKIIGVTETGVIRKRSFKRKLTKEERDKRGYGNDRVEYEQIVQRVMSERLTTSAIEALRDRGKMLAFMHTDCLDMLEKWEARRRKKIDARKNQDRDFMIVVGAVGASLLFLCLLIWLCLW